jgi:AcrR family transcriptional regulator
MMQMELEDVALRLFQQRGFGEVTVEEIASEARVSVRTFYRYFPTKEDVLQLKIDRRSRALRDALAARPPDEAPLHSARVAMAEVVAAEDMELGRRWTDVIYNAPAVVRGVLGGIQMKTARTMVEFFASRLQCKSDDLVPTMLAAACVGVMQAAQARWWLDGGDLVETLSEGLGVLEGGIGTEQWTAFGDAAGNGAARSRRTRAG